MCDKEKLKNALAPSGELKGIMIGEFTMDIEQTCPACYNDDSEDDCELCGGEATFTVPHVIPWPLQKEIYQKMLDEALNLVDEDFC